MSQPISSHSSNPQHSDSEPDALTMKPLGQLGVCHTMLNLLQRTEQVIPEGAVLSHQTLAVSLLWLIIGSIRKWDKATMQRQSITW